MRLLRHILVFLVVFPRGLCHIVTTAGGKVVVVVALAGAGKDAVRTNTVPSGAR